MIEERARVVANDGAHVWIETQRQSTCGNCSVNKGCGTAVLSGVLGVRRTRIRAKNELMELRPGEAVIVGMQDNALVYSAAAFFGLPIALMLFAAIAGNWLLQQLGLHSGEGARIILGLGGLASGVVWTMLWARRKQRDGNYDLRVLRRLSPVNEFVPLLRRDKSV